MIKRHFQLLVTTYVTFLTSPAYAEFEKAQTLLNKVAIGLRGLTFVTVTIAVMWVGYKMLFKGSTFADCALVIGAATFIACASEIGRLFAV